jgi:DNA-binding response OmpR family regulator
VVVGVGLRTSSRLSVLVVDDEQDTLEFLKDFLSLEGFEVTTLRDPTLAVECLRNAVFHLVVVDTMMPKLTGFELLAQIRAFDEDITVIMINTNTWREPEATSIELGVSAQLGAPIAVDDFRDALARIENEKGFGGR